MARLTILAAVLLSLSFTAAFSTSQYYNISRSIFETSKTYSQNVSVTLLGPLTATSSDVITTSAVFAGGRSIIYTVTSFYVDPAASWCAGDTLFYGTRGCSSTSTTTPPIPTATTHYWAPLIIAAPTSCTKTSFSYTSSELANPTALPGTMGQQATSSALFITTYVLTLSTDLGGQAVTTSVVDVYLSAGVLLGVQPNLAQANYLDQCVDPSSKLCTSTGIGLSQLGCGPLPITYPPTAAHITGAGTTTATTGASSPAATTSSKSGAASAWASPGWSVLVGSVVLVFCVFM